MRLIDALKRVRENQALDGPSFSVRLACGFSPHHVKTFLQAQLIDRVPNRLVKVETGVYGDLGETLKSWAANESNSDAIVVMIEWSDLDARLGFRASHGWRPESLPDILATGLSRLEGFRTAIESLSEQCQVVVSLPHTPLPPMFNLPSIYGNAISFALEERIFRIASELSETMAVRVVDPRTISRLSPPDSQFDLNADLSSGFPYSISHTATLCGAVADILCPKQPKKGIITDLDNTLWNGILGDVGVEGISWSLDRRTHSHALYQEMLASLSKLGVLLAVASKNDAILVEEALNRADLVVPGKSLFPVIANWGRKSESVQQILDIWNIDAQDVVFVDDSPLEIAEVKNAFPQIEGIQFPAGSDRDLLSVLEKLRSLCGKATATVEDQIRSESVKAIHSFRTKISNTDASEFLSQLDAELSIVWNKPDVRTFELINKTNQFNLNGVRLDPSSWKERLANERHFLLAASYKDKFGPLGTISVVSGYRDTPSPLIDVWVMSCRAFSRSIEYQVLKSLFDMFEVDALRLHYVETKRNGPFCQFIDPIAERSEDGIRVIRKERFTSECPTVAMKVAVQ